MLQGHEEVKIANVKGATKHLDVDVDNKPTIGLLSTFGAEFLSDLMEVQSPLVNAVHVIAPALTSKVENVFLYRIKYQNGHHLLGQVLNQVISQIQMSWNLVRVHNRVDFWIFMGCDVFILPVLMAKLMHARVFLTLLGNLEKEIEFRDNLLNPAQIVFKGINCALSDRIVVYSRCLVQEWQLERYSRKILIAQSLFVDFTRFRIEKELAVRDPVIGYVGRLSPEKGIWNFVRAVPIVLQANPDLRFIIVGDGPLYKPVSQYLRNENLNERVILVGKVPYHEIPKYLNQMCLCVLPSASEGMPATILEAMACGTPVLSTQVGAIADVIAEGQTGFTMKNNSPQCIAENILRVLGRTDLPAITASARQLIERQFSLGAAQEKYKNVILEAAKL